MSLSNLQFSDLFVCEDIASSWFKATPDSLATQPVPNEHAIELGQLRTRLESQKGQSAFKLDWPAKGGMRLRVERMQIADDRMIYVCRNYRIAPGPMNSLGMPHSVTQRLMDSTLREGLVIFLGKAGAGKTTTAASFIIERLTRFGGVCWTVENPIELPMQGKHGNGWCYQTEARDDEEIGKAVIDMLRATPNIIFIGELRDRSAVKEALTAATSGHLVVATFHSADLLTGLARLARMHSDDKSAAALADALKVAIHLSLYNAAPENPLPNTAFTTPNAKGTGTPPRILSVEPIWMSAQAEEGLRSIVRDGEFHLLRSEVDRQRRSLLMGRLP